GRTYRHAHAVAGDRGWEPLITGAWKRRQAGRSGSATARTGAAGMYGDRSGVRAPDRTFPRTRACARWLRPPHRPRLLVAAFVPGACGLAEGHQHRPDNAMTRRPPPSPP